MNFLITGGKGFLGSIITEHLLSEQHSCSSLGRHVENEITCDLSKQVPNISKSFDYVIHVAGKAHVLPNSDDDEKDFFNINVNGTTNLLKGIDKKNLKGIIFISSVAVYGKDTGNRIKEDDPLLATDPYGKSKIEAEQYLITWGAKNSIPITILRLPLILGKDAPGNLGKMVRAISKGAYANIGGGKAKRSVVIATDIARQLPLFFKNSGIYNLTDNQDPSFNELSLVIAKKLNKKFIPNLPKLLAVPLAVIGDVIKKTIWADVPFSTYSLNKMTSDLTFDTGKALSLGWKPTVAINHSECWL